MSTEPEITVMTVHQVAEYLQLSHWTIRHWVSDPKNRNGFPYHRITRRIVRFYKHEIDRWIRNKGGHKKHGMQETQS